MHLIQYECKAIDLDSFKMQQSFRALEVFEMAVQTEEKKLKVKKGKEVIKETSKDETKPAESTGEKSKEAPLIKLEDSQMKEALVAFKKLVELRDSEGNKQDLLGNACGEGRKVQVSVAAIKLPRVSDAQVHINLISLIDFSYLYFAGAQTAFAPPHYPCHKRRLLDCERF